MRAQERQQLKGVACYIARWTDRIGSPQQKALRQRWELASLSSESCMLIPFPCVAESVTPLYTASSKPASQDSLLGSVWSLVSGWCRETDGYECGTLEITLSSPEYRYYEKMIVTYLLGEKNQFIKKQYLFCKGEIYTYVYLPYICVCIYIYIYHMYIKYVSVNPVCEILGIKSCPRYIQSKNFTNVRYYLILYLSGGIKGNYSFLFVLVYIFKFSKIICVIFIIRKKMNQNVFRPHQQISFFWPKKLAKVKNC